MTVALGPIEHMEIPELDTVDSMINHSLKQFETWENIGTKLEISLEGLIKRVEGIAAVSLPLFPKDSLGDKKDQSIDPGSDKREIDVQVDLPFEEVS